MAINTIGPLWDGNEVWLIVAGAAIFAAFPGWYATMFSALYLALVLLLAALIVRGVSFEFRGKRDSAALAVATGAGCSRRGACWPRSCSAWRSATCSTACRSTTTRSSRAASGDLLDPVRAVRRASRSCSLCVLHGATFLSLRTTGEMRERAHAVARRFTIVTGLAVLVFGVWTQITLDRGAVPDLIPVAAVLAVLAVAWLLREGREGWAFAMTTFAMAATVITIFIDLYPRVMVSSTNPAYSLTVENTASSSYALKVMTVVAVVFLPIVLVYQAWTYHVFRRRLSPSDLSGPESGDESTEGSGPEPAGAASTG